MTDYLRLKYLLNRRTATRPKEREDKVIAITLGLVVDVLIVAKQKKFPKKFFLLNHEK